MAHERMCITSGGTMAETGWQDQSFCTFNDRPKHCELDWSALSVSRGLSSSPPAKLRISTEQALTCCWLMGSFLRVAASYGLSGAVHSDWRMTTSSSNSTKLDGLPERCSSHGRWTHLNL